jgi:hypothetical protein
VEISPMYPDYSQVVMEDKDLYTGYGYALINKTANKVAKTAIDNVRSWSDVKGAVHPYVEVLDQSPTFSLYQFWKHISIYIDLEGVYYLMAVRNVADNRVGSIQEFKLLNPYNITRILDSNNMDVGGYVETRKGMQRDIPKEMIIEIRDLNPFSEDIAYAMTDAAKESQFTLKTSGDHTRNALKHNINAPGIINTDVILPDEQFQNFKARVNAHTKGEPIFGNGAKPSHGKICQ